MFRPDTSSPIAHNSPRLNMSGIQSPTGCEWTNHMTMTIVPKWIASDNWCFSCGTAFVFLLSPCPMSLAWERMTLKQLFHEIIPRCYYELLSRFIILVAKTDARNGVDAFWTQSRNYTCDQSGFVYPTWFSLREWAQIAIDSTLEGRHKCILRTRWKNLAPSSFLVPFLFTLYWEPVPRNK